jgi:2-dehydro-3-deoxygluconokinase
VDDRQVKRFDVVGLGEALIEFNETEPGLYRQGIGGDTSNVVIAAARHGARAAYLTRIGTDRLGDLLLAAWASEGVDASGVVRDGAAPTGAYFVSHTPSGHAFSYARRGSAASRMRPDELDLVLLRSARFLHVSGISLAIGDAPADTVFAAIAHARAAGVAVSFDTNLRLSLLPLARARALTFEAASQADLCLPSLDDATALTGLRDPDAIVDFFLARGARGVVLKMGAAGVLLADAALRERIAGHAVAALDATGAGDAFDGALLGELARGVTLAEAARFANAAAALSTRGYGAVAPLPRRAEVTAFLAEIG